jgi:ATP synthase protein I
MIGETPSPHALQSLDARLKRLRAEVSPVAAASVDAAPTTGLGMAFMVSAHLVAGLLVGCLIGLSLDRWLGTAPAFLIAFFFLGAAAGGLNVFRTVRGYGLAVGYRLPGAGDEGRGGRPGLSGSGEATNERRG